MAQLDRARYQATHGVAPPAPARPAAARQPPLAALQRFAGNAAVAQLLEASPPSPAAPPQPARPIVPTVSDVDPRARVDIIQRAIVLNPMLRRFDVSMDLMVEALTDLTPDDARAVREEYRRRTSWNLRWVVTGQLPIPETFGVSEGATIESSLGRLERQRLLNLMDGTAVAPIDPERALAAGESFGALAAGAARLLGRDDIAEELGDRAAATAAAQVTADQGRQRAEAEANRYRAEAATIRRHIERTEGEQAIAMVRRPDPERQALAGQYRTLYGTELYLDLTTRLKGTDAARAAATWIEDYVTADSLALGAELARQRSVDAAATILESAGSGDLLGPSTMDLATRELGRRNRREARGKVEQRLAGIAAAGEQDAQGDRTAGREHLAQVLDRAGATPGATLRTELAAQGGRVAQAIVVDDEAQELAARLARADVEGTLKVADLEAALRHLRSVARRVVVERITRQPNLAPFAEQLLVATTAGTYDAFRRRFDADDTKRTLDKALDIGGAVEEERNRALLGSLGELPAWRELDLALRRDPKDMDRVRAILGRKDRPTIVGIATEYQEHTGRLLETDLLGTPEQRRLAEFLDEDKAKQEHVERLVLLGGGRFRSENPDEAARLEEERQWVGARNFALKRAVIQNRGTFARARDWLGNIEKDLVERADRDIDDANIAASRALNELPPDLAAAREAVAAMHRAGARLERNLDVYKEATKAAFDEFVDLAVLAVTTIVTLGEGTAVVMAIRATIATVGTKLVLKGDDYSLDEFLMDLRSGLGAAAGGKLAEGVLKPVATKVAGYAAKAGLSTGLTGKVAGYAGKAAMWEGEQVITTGATNIATGQDLGTGLGLRDQGKALAQHGVVTGIKAARGGRGGSARGEEEASTTTRPAGADETTTTTRPAGLDEPSAVRPDAADPVAEGPGAQVEAAGDGGEPVRVPMALPEPGRPATTEPSTTRRRTGSDEEPATRRRPGEEASAEEPTPLPAEDVEDFGPDTQPDIEVPLTDRQRRERAEQERRARRHPGDAASFRESTAPGARSRAFAKELAPIFEDWGDLHPVERLARLEEVMNGPLRAAGAPTVYVESGDRPPGSASFDVTSFKVTVSEQVINSRTITPEDFARLAENIAHEGRHALHHFRGLRMAEAQGLPTTRADLQPAERAVRAAEEANAGTRPAEALDLDAPRFREAREVFQQTFGPGGEERLRVIRVRESTKRRLAAAEAALRGTTPGTPEHEAASEAVRVATEDATRAHNEYMALPQETDAWRTGLGTRGAMLQELKAQQVRSLFDARTKAATELQRARRAVARAEGAGTDATSARAREADALRAYRDLRERLVAARRELQVLQDATSGETLRAREQEERRARIRARRAAGGAT